MNMRAPRRYGFTLIELLVVIAIIAILAALLFPAAGVMRSRSMVARCMSNVRQIAVAAQNQFGELDDVLPARSSGAASGEGAEQLLPYLRNLIGVFDCPANKGIDRGGTLAFPSYSGRFTEYALNPYLCSTPGNERRQSLIDDFSLAAYAYDTPYDPSSAVRAHQDGFNVAYLDGHAAWMPDNKIVVAGEDFTKRGHSADDIP